MVVIELRGRVISGRWADLVAFLSSGIPFYQAPGGIRVRLLRDVHDPDAFVEMIEYEGQETYELDQQRVATDPTMKQLLEQWRGLLAEPIRERTLRDVTPVPGSLSPPWDDEESWQ